MVIREIRDGEDKAQLPKLAGFYGGAMVRRAYAQRSVFEVLLLDGDKLWDPILRQIGYLVVLPLLRTRTLDPLARPQCYPNVLSDVITSD